MNKIIAGLILFSTMSMASAGPCFIKIQNNDTQRPETRMVNVENIVSIFSYDKAVYVYVSPIGAFKINVADTTKIPTITEALRFEAENCGKLK